MYMYMYNQSKTSDSGKVIGGVCAGGQGYM